MSVSTLRAALPEFGNAATYPDSAVTFWLNIATAIVDGYRYGQLTEMATYMFAAHNLTLSGQALRAGANGVVGYASGPMSAKSIKDLSISYDSKVSSIDGAGNFNLTTYGQRYWWIMEMAGAGGIQLGTPWEANYGAGFGYNDIYPLYV